MIENIKASGASRAKAICDICGREEVVACDYSRMAGGSWAPDEGQIRRKLIGSGWAFVKAELNCPTCEAKRKAKNAKPAWLKDAEKTHTSEAKMTEKTATFTELRKATPAQRREIHQHLLSFYDTKAGRYQDTATDKTIADMIGGGCMPGWVAEIRDADYGPDGGNAELDAVRAEVEAMRRDFDGKIAAMVKRIDAIKAAVGPKAVRA